jgi:PAS domain S-box-containing protein
MQLDWRAILGPALTAATAAAALAADRLMLDAPNPAPLFVGIVALAGSLSGLHSSLTSAVLALVSSALFFSAHGVPVGTSASDLTRLSMLAVAVIGTAILTGLLRQRLIDTLVWERRHHATAERLSAALDQVDIGIVLLDSDTRAEFINRAFRQYFGLSDEKAESKPPFIALMYHGRDNGAYEMPEEELSTFIARRTEMMRAGDSTPINLNLSDGQVLRFSCTALPDGGRMLSYTPVTELVRRTDDPARADHFRAMRGKRLHGPFTDQRAAE